MIALVPDHLLPCLAELVLGAGALLLVLVSRIPSLRARGGDFTLLVLALAALGAVASLDAPQGWLVERLTVTDPFASFFRFELSICAMGAVWLATRSREAGGRSGAMGWAVFLASLLGMLLMGTAVSGIAAWLGFTIVNLASGLWIGWRPDAGAAARSDALAALLLGSAASAVLLLGFALLYGISGSFEYAVVARKLGIAMAAPGGASVLFAAVVLLLAGISYRIAKVPWHAWRVDLAGTASVPVSAWMETGGTIAGFAMLARFVHSALAPAGDAASEGAWAALRGSPWPELLSVAAMATLAVGSAMALRERNLRRLLAWLSVAQTGSLMTGLVALSDDGLSALLFHSVAFSMATIGALAALAPALEQSGGSDLELLRGLARRPGGFWPALATAVFVLSLAAVPPLAGWQGRTLLFEAVVAADRPLLASCMTACSAVTLLAAVRLLATLLDRPASEARLEGDFEAALLAGLLVAATLLLGIEPGLLESLTRRSVVFFAG